MDSGLQPKRLGHRKWRRLAKRERRNRLRRRAAQERDAEAEILKRKLQSTEDYCSWLEEQSKAREERERHEEIEHAAREQAWLEAEKRAQEEWAIVQQRKAKARQLQLEQEEKLRQEFEEMSSKRRERRDDRRDDRRDSRRDDRRDERRDSDRSESSKRRREERDKMSEQLRKDLDDYIEKGIATPEALRQYSETQPRKEICPFFAKTGACRYGDACSRNHQKPMLSSKICVPGFYTHFSLEKHRGEYDTDVRLEYESRETRNHFREFYTDVVPELEKFGKIKTLQYCKNTEPHLRGNLYVEYFTERDAARALRGLRGRWYAGRQLNCEFVDFKSWRGAVCGMSRCPKGSSCNFLHVFKNPSSDYDVKSPPLWQRRQENFEKSDRDDSFRSDRRNNRTRNNWDDNDTQRNKNWRWSESPERRRQNFNNNRNQRGRFDNNRRFDNRFNSNMNNRNRQGYFNARQRFPPGRDNQRFRNDRNVVKYNGRSRRRYSYSGSEDGRRSGSRGRSRSPRKYSDSGSDHRNRSYSGSRSRSISRSRSRSGSRSRSRSRSRKFSREIEKKFSRSPSPKQKSPRNRRNDGEFSDRRERSYSGPPSPPGKPEDYEVISKTSDVEVISVSSANSRDGKRKSARSKWDSQGPPMEPPEHRDPRSKNQSFHSTHPEKSEKSNQERPQFSSKSGHADNARAQGDYEWDTTESEGE